MRKVDLYPDHLEELLKALTAGKKGRFITVSDDTTLQSFEKSDKSLKELERLKKKYNLDNLKNTDYLYEIVEKMYDYRPF